MSITVVYRDGKFVPLEPVSLPEESVIEISFEPSPPSDQPRGTRPNCFQLLGNKHFYPPSEDFYELPPEFEEYVQ